MIIRDNFMKNSDGLTPVIPGVSTPFEYVQQQTKIRNANTHHDDKKPFNDNKPNADVRELRKLDQENSLRRFSNNASGNRPFGKN